MVAIRTCVGRLALAPGGLGAIPEIRLRLRGEIQAVLLRQLRQALQYLVPATLAFKPEPLAPGLGGLEPEAPVLELERGIEGLERDEILLCGNHRRAEDVAFRAGIVVRPA